MADAHGAGAAHDERELASAATSWLTYLSANPGLALTLFLAIAISATRLSSLAGTHPQTVSRHGLQPPPRVPCWLPFLGHVPDLAVDAHGFVQKLRRVYPGGICAVNLGGYRHNIIYTPGLAAALLDQTQCNADAEDVSRSLMVKVFGYPSRQLGRYDQGMPELRACYQHLLSEPYLGQMVDRTARLTKENVNNLVTFMDSPVDQMQWERAAKVDVTERDGQPTVEANLLDLVRDFCACTANPSVMGSDFLNNFPDFFHDLWTFDRGLLLLATGLPRWFPIPSLTRAHIARRNAINKLTVFHEQLEKWSRGEPTDATWASLDDVGSLEQARLAVYQKHHWSMRARAAAEHAFMWAMTVNSTTLVFWMIVRIYADPSLLAMLREEIAACVHMVPEQTDLPIPSPARIASVDTEGLCHRCPLLNSTYVECLRVDSAPWSLKRVKRDFVLQGREPDAGPWLLRKGDYAHAAHEVHNTDARHWEDPTLFKPDRHIQYDDKHQRATADLGSIRAYGGGSSMCKGRSFARKECLLFTAAIISMWEIEPAGEGKWTMPRHRKATGVYGTDDVTRVWLRRREVRRAQ